MTTTTTCRSGDDEEDAASPTHTFVGTQAARPGPDNHHPVHRPPNGNGKRCISLFLFLCPHTAASRSQGVAWGPRPRGKGKQPVHKTTPLGGIKIGRSSAERGARAWARGRRRPRQMLEIYHTTPGQVTLIPKRIHAANDFSSYNKESVLFWWVHFLLRPSRRQPRPTFF